MEDFVAGIAKRWAQLRPELDPTPLLVIGRIDRLGSLINEQLRPPFAAAGLAAGDFDLLAALRRQGPPHEASPGELAAAMLVTTGGTTKRIDRLERQGYVSRRPSEVDGRGRVVALTAKGRKLTDELIAVHLANEARILDALTPDQREQLAELLGVLAEAVEELSSASSGGSSAGAARGTTSRPRRSRAG